MHKGKNFVNGTRIYIEGKKHVRVWSARTESRLHFSPIGKNWRNCLRMNDREKTGGCE
jgi:hypothetical protein